MGLITTTYASDELYDNSIFAWEVDFWDFVLTTISLFVLFAGLFSIIFILRGGLLLILSGGKDDKIKPAINTIRYAVIGVIITVLTIFLFPVFGRLLGLDVEKYAQPKRIFEKIEELWDKVFWGSSSSDPVDIDSIEDFPADFSDL